MLKKVGIVKSRTKSYKLFTDVISSDFLTIPKMKSSEYIKYCWNLYKTKVPLKAQTNAMNGNIFELIIVSELYRNSILPMYLQAQVAFVPNIKFDVLLYTSEKSPIGISLKTSFRERYKQADLEAVALKYVHRKAKNYLITIDSAEAKRAKERLLTGELLGIDEIIYAVEDDIDNMIKELKDVVFVESETINVIEKGRLVKNP